jgi:hypothetical protein
VIDSIKRIVFGKEYTFVYAYPWLDPKTFVSNGYASAYKTIFRARNNNSAMRKMFSEAGHRSAHMAKLYQGDNLIYESKRYKLVKGDVERDFPTNKKEK